MPEPEPEPEPEPAPAPPPGPNLDLEPEPLFDPSIPLVEATEDLLPEENAPSSLQASPTPAPADEGADKKKWILIGSIVGGLILVIVLAFVFWPPSSSPKPPGKRASAMQPMPHPRPMRRAVPVMTGAPDAEARPAVKNQADAGTKVDPMAAVDAAISTKAVDATAAAAKPDAEADDNEDGLSNKEKRNRLMSRAYRHLRRGRYAKSRSFLTRALKIDDSARLRRYFSRSYEKVGKFWPAIYHMKKAVKFSPRSARQHAKLGTLYLRVGQHGNACRSFRYAVRYKRNHKLATRQLAKHCQ